ncbi:RNA-binding protein [Grosmannia clavigera kw1407]|uniref:RNA-binding protein n=1 Tax=Grosmannia clavigera (strain kw1407 / UAMH 11150) TaxID=655863 RepID=F0XUV2_GROCL|nr:RNA-binding protein [Grosmannia clavigera kw1407]EFW98639.1 RNA-binding protein [Grosmannia clavigera kw1407]
MAVFQQQPAENGGHARRGRNTPIFVGNSDAALHHQGATGTPAHLQEDGLGGLMTQFRAMGLANGNMAPAGPAMHGINPGTFVTGADGSILFAAPYAGPLHPILAEHHAYGTAAYPIQYSAGGYPAAYATGSMIPLTPGRPMAYGDRVPRDLPILENRRSSYSTSATESTPTTPYFGHISDRNGGTRVASLERSSFTTPSPRDTTTYVPGNQAKIAIDPEIERLLAVDPPVPKAVPAVWTDHVKPMEQCLKNRIQERFGEVEQSKAIIDTATGACKGFGFAKFRDVKNSEKCIRGFYRLGYEVGFARESFNARLKAEGDESSTNLYISNLPKDINEAMLNHIFEPFHVVSSKILRDSMGNSRGVGFARFDTRDICEKVIKHFNGITVGQDHFVMQVRYADTPSQKELKRITAERRQYRTNEYNIGAYGTHAVGMNPSIYGPAVWNRRPQGSTGHRQEEVNDVHSASSEEGSADEGATVIEPSIAGSEFCGSPKPSSVEAIDV